MAKAQELKAKNIVIATGSHTALIPGVKVDGERIMTYWEAIMSPKLPTSAIIIGAGAIGVEFATVWNGYGVDVTMVEMLPRIVPLEDEEISAELNKAFNKRGIKTLTGTKVLSIETTEKGVAVKVAAPDGEKDAGGRAGAGGDRVQTQQRRPGPGSPGGEAFRSAVLSRSTSAWRPTSRASGPLAM